jgi:spermidine synthase
LGGIKILEKVQSPLNGEIVVQTDLAWGPHILVEGLSQSGGVIKKVWKPLFLKLKNLKFKNILILGLGGGTVAKFSNKYWPEAKITGVELDPEMVRLGEKHLGLMNVKVETYIQDAFEYLSNRKSKISNHFDLVFIDIFTGRSVPEKFTTESFVKEVKKILTNNGVAVFNCLYGGQNTSKTEKFVKILKKVFSDVDAVYPIANVMYICKK